MGPFHLYWRDRDLGEVPNLSADFPEAWATFTPGPGLDKLFLDLFEFPLDEDRSSENPTFDGDLLDERNWWLLDIDGNR